MPLSALCFYLESKYEHEMVRDVFITDMLMYSARAHVKNPEKMPRYWDAIRKKGQNAKAPHKDYTEQEIIDMFRGKG